MRSFGIAPAFEPSEADVIRCPPRPSDEPILLGFLLWRVAFVSTLFFCGIFGIFWSTQAEGATLKESRTYALNTLVAIKVFCLFSVRRLSAPSLTLSGMKGTRPVLISLGIVVTLHLTFTYAHFMEAFFDTRPVDFVHGTEMLGIGVALFAILDVEKRMIPTVADRRGR